jgi:hypothetical protein
MNKGKSTKYKYHQKVNDGNFKIIDVEQMRYDKKIAFIYNPNSGIKLDRRDTIAKTMDQYNIPYEIFLTKK